MGQLYSTQELPPNKQFDYWREELCDVFIELKPERKTNGDFEAEIYHQPLSEVSVSRVTAAAHTVKRTPAEINNSSKECYFANLQLKGIGRTRQQNKEIIAKPGDLVLVDACKPYDILHNEAFDLISVEIPYGLLENQRKLQCGESTVHVPAERGYTKLLHSYTTALLNDLNIDLLDTTSLLAENLVNLIAITLNSSAMNTGSDKLASHQYSRLQAISGYINCHLSDPLLDLQRVSKHFNLSPRYIQKLFAATGTTFSEVVLSRRLDKCAALLRSSEYDKRKLSEIAFAWGLNDFSYFSRAFKKLYGVSPRDYRKSHFINH